jgi:uncharacterized Zn finger protein (UPF0148 family)
MTAPDQANPDQANAAELQQEIEQTREHLGQTVDELAAKADVKSRARAKTAEVKGKAADVSGQVRRSRVVQRRWPLAVAAVGVILVGSIAVWRRRKT